VVNVCLSLFFIKINPEFIGNFEPHINYEKMDKAEVISLFNDKLLAGSLSMTSVKIM
jgi:hypothetical protein